MNFLRQSWFQISSSLATFSLRSTLTLTSQMTKASHLSPWQKIKIVIRVLLKAGAKADNVYKSYRKHLGRLSTEKPLISPVKLFVTGDGGSGKSTTVQSLQVEPSALAIFIQPREVKGVNQKTAGIVPYLIFSKSLGYVKVFDFAGQREYYGSHAAVIRNAVSTSPPIFIHVVNLQRTPEEITDNTRYWLNTIRNQCSKMEGQAHVIVVGSHADKLKEAKEDPSPKRRAIEQVVAKFPEFKMVEFIPMDCRYPQSNDMKVLRRQLEKTCTALRSKLTVNLNSHSFLIYLLDKFKGESNGVVTLKRIQKQIEEDLKKEKKSKREEDLLSFIPLSLPHLEGICTQLNDKGHIMFLRDAKALEESYVILDSTSLLSEVNGTIFAPEGFDEYCRLASSTGVVPRSKLEERFPQYKIEMLVAFLTHMEFCVAN